MSRNSHDLLLQWLSGAGLDEDWESGLQTSAGRVKEAVKAIVFNRIDISGQSAASTKDRRLKEAVSNSPMPLSPITLASSSGLVSGLLPQSTSIEGFNSATSLKLGPPPMTEKLKEQVVRTIRDEDAGPNGTASPQGVSSTLHNGHPKGDGNGDFDMASPRESRGVSKELMVQEIKPEPNGDETSDLVSPGELDTLPPVPAVFRIADLKREVEAVRDKRKMIRLGPGVDEGKVGSSGALLPSVVAFTVFDGGEG
jgi:transcription initiation factor TFIID subunit 5